MGFLKTFLIITFPGTAVATFFAFRLGSELPKASRKLGRKIGLGYHYFKVILKVLAPQTEVPAEMMDVLRKTNQQIVSLNRELRANVIKAKQEVSQLFPDEIKKNPFEILCLFKFFIFIIIIYFLIDLKPDTPIENPTGLIIL